jgi:hypothetical protein
MEAVGEGDQGGEGGCRAEEVVGLTSRVHYHVVRANKGGKREGATDYYPLSCASCRQGNKMLFTEV